MLTRGPQVTLVDGADVIDLHAYVAGGVRSVEDVELDSGKLVERRAGVGFCAETEMDLGSKFCEYVDGCLDVVNLVLENVVVIRCQWSGVESRDVDGFGTYLRVGHDAVGALLDAGPQTALQEGTDSLLGRDGFGLGKIELGILRFRVSLDSDFEKLSLLSSDNFADSAAHR